LPKVRDWISSRAVAASGPLLAGIGVRGGPVRGQELVRHAAVEEAAHRPKLVVEVLVQLLVDLVPAQVVVWPGHVPVEARAHEQHDAPHSFATSRAGATVR
jgi:hypothetical protein